MNGRWIFPNYSALKKEYTRWFYIMTDTHRRPKEYKRYLKKYDGADSCKHKLEIKKCICCILTFDPAKHTIPKTVEMTHSDGQLWEEIA